jgi:hypothetical protein
MHVFYLDTQNPLVYTFSTCNLALAEITISEMSPLHISGKFNLNTWIQALKRFSSAQFTKMI